MKKWIKCFWSHDWEKIDGAKDRFHQLWKCRKCGKEDRTAVIGNTHGLGI